MKAARRAMRAHLAILLVIAAAACGGEEEPRYAAEPAAEPGIIELPDAAFPVVTDDMVPHDAAAADWAVHGGSFANRRYSRLDQINRENVRALTPVWVYETGIPESFETTPLVVGNTMYLTTAESHVIALNAASGEELWRFVPDLGTTALCCGPNNRGVAAHGEHVYVGTVDAHLIALDHRTGEVQWERQLADSEDGYSITMAPLAAAGRVFIGVSGGEYGIRGFVDAYDAESGERIWRFHTVPAPSEAPNGWFGEGRATTPFGTPLNRDLIAEQDDREDHDDAWEEGGGGVRMTPAYWPAAGRLYISIGNPSPDLAGSVRPGDNLYTGSIVALDAESGELAWYFQYLPHDRWNLSGGSGPFLFEQDGRTLVAHAGKTGWLYVVDADTGEPVLRSQNFVPQENLFAEPTSDGTVMSPGMNGGTISPAAYSERTGLAYLLASHQPMIFRREFTPRQEGLPWLGGSFVRVPEAEEWGALTAVDLATGEIRWQRRVPMPMLGAALATAGDLVFAGQGDGTFDAFDAESGELLWQFPAGAGVHGGPVTYMVDSVQYVAVAAGGSFHFDTQRGDNLYVFALPDRRAGSPLRRYGATEYERTDPERYGAVRQVPASSLGEAPADPPRGERSQASDSAGAQGPPS